MGTYMSTDTVAAMTATGREPSPEWWRPGELLWSDGCSIRSFTVATVTVAAGMATDAVRHEQTLGVVCWKPT